MDRKRDVTEFFLMLTEMKADRVAGLRKETKKYFDKYHQQHSASRFFDGIEDSEITMEFARKLRDRISDFYNYRTRKVLSNISTKDLVEELERRGCKIASVQTNMFDSKKIKS